MSKRNRLTYYMHGASVASTYTMATNLNMDIRWIKQHVDNCVVGTYFSGAWWCIGQSVLTIDLKDALAAMDHMMELPDDHEIVKAIKMAELIGALPKPED